MTLWMNKILKPVNKSWTISWNFPHYILQSQIRGQTPQKHPPFLILHGKSILEIYFRILENVLTEEGFWTDTTSLFNMYCTSFSLHDLIMPRKKICEKIHNLILIWMESICIQLKSIYVKKFQNQKKVLGKISARQVPISQLWPGGSLTLIRTKEFEYLIEFNWNKNCSVCHYLWL